MSSTAHIETAGQWSAFRGRSWSAVADEGRVQLDTERGWHIDFRSVVFPPSRKPKRVRISKTQDAGKFQGYEEAERCLTLIRQRAMSRPLYEVLLEYMPKPAEEMMVPQRYLAEFVASKRVAQARGEISKERVDELEGHHRRGRLAFWAECPVGRIDGPAVERWYEWLRSTFPKLQDRTIKHVVADFSTFCHYMRRMGALAILPEFPRVKVQKRKRSVPKRESLDRVLAHIPEAERGLFLARTCAGLRPAEARRLDVRDWDAEERTIRIRAEICKTGEERILPIAEVAPELVQWILAHRASATPWEPLFPFPRSKATQANERRWTETPERRVWLAAIEAAGVEHVAPNLGGRHAFATREAHGGTDLLALKDWMGHQSVKTTEVYLHTDTHSLARRMRPVQKIAKDSAKEA